MRRVKDGAFHFWDAVDDFSRTNMDLIFEHDRLYLHDASGHFGAVPMSITGVLHSLIMISFSSNLRDQLVMRLQ